MNCELLEPCCYTKQFNAALTESRADVIELFHSGDVDVVRFLDRVASYSVADSTLWLVLPHFAQHTIEALQKILAYTRYVDGQSHLCFPTVNILTREVTPDLQSLKARPCQTITIAIDKQLGMRLIGFTAPATVPSASPEGSFHATVPSASPEGNQPTSLFISGSLIQSIQFGAHMVTIHRGKQQASMLTPYLSRQIRFHKSLEIKS